MKLKTLSAAAIAASFFLASCGSEPSNDGQVETPVVEQEQTEEVAVAEVYAIDTANSEVTWSGKKVFLDDGHNGTIGIQSGSAEITEGKLTGGELVIDMNSIKVSDIGIEQGSEKLIAHLAGTAEDQANDFFNAPEFPTAKFVISAVTDSSLIGDLTIKDTTLTYAAPATVVVNESDVTINGSLTFDRSKFGVDFGTEKALGPLDKLVGDAKGYAIQNDIEIGFNLVAKK